MMKARNAGYDNTRYEANNTSLFVDGQFWHNLIASHKPDEAACTGDHTMLLSYYAAFSNISQYYHCMGTLSITRRLPIFGIYVYPCV